VTCRAVAPGGHEFFKANGIAESQITVRFHGERYPLAEQQCGQPGEEPSGQSTGGGAAGQPAPAGRAAASHRQLLLTRRSSSRSRQFCRFVVISCRASVNYAARPLESAFRTTPWSDGMADVNKVVLAYSGGLDTSVILKWLQDTYNCEVVTFTADLGQGEEVEPARAKAQAMGVKEIYIDDLREEFVRDFVSRCSAPTPSTKASTCWVLPSLVR
jgi:hypothetical protein